MVVCLERGADLHMAQLMPLPLTVSCFSKIQIGFIFLVPAHPGNPGQGAVKRVCVIAKPLNRLSCTLFASRTRKVTVSVKVTGHVVHKPTHGQSTRRQVMPVNCPSATLPCLCYCSKEDADTSWKSYHNVFAVCGRLYFSIGQTENENTVIESK